ncbi:glycosyl hydrolase family 8, partial [Leptospira sp. SA-E8]|uniref:glycosyl hydrolase family 8 n=1 Tax=Leptospira sp. SA-E8 TaxID=3422259 RepID=UPI003EBA3F73
EETAVIPGLGLALLPGPQGFTPRPGSYRLNPSYSPIQLMRRLAALHAQTAWSEIAATSLVLIVQSSPHGYAPDWVLHQDGALVPDTQTQGVGSYDAIRVYLWAGLMHEDEPARTVLLAALAPMARQTADEGLPPLRVDTASGAVRGSGPVGFSAAVLPFLAVSNLPAAERAQRQRLTAEQPLTRQGNYYDQVLTLFGLGWADEQYRFARGGALIPKWSCSAN